MVPNVLGPARPAAAWGDAATVVPWVLNERYADVATLERQYPSMKAWTDVLLDIAGDRRLWEGRFQFGDWLDPDAPPDQPARAKTDGDIVASAYLFRSADAVARAARLLGDEADAERYAALAEEVRAAFLDEYVTPSGRMVSDAQTAYAMAIVFEIAPASLIPALGARLAELTRESGYKIGTGFVGTPIIQDALTRTGHLDTARRLLVQTENPSWLYPVTMGATTIWERWDSMLPDGTINPGQMTSFNHYAFGAIGDWLHRVVAGLAPDAPGYERIRIAPHPLDGIDSAVRRAPHSLRPGSRGVDAHRRPHPHRGHDPAEHDGDGRAAGRAHARGGLGDSRMGGGCRARGAAAGSGRIRLEPRRGDRRSGGVPSRSSTCSRRESPPRRTHSRPTRNGSPAAISARRSSTRPARSCSSSSPTDWPSCRRRARKFCDDRHQGGFDMAVSVKDVAAAASVSVGTVSNVLNTPSKVAPATVERVLLAIEELGFVRNDAARQLRAGPEPQHRTRRARRRQPVLRRDRPRRREPCGGGRAVGARRQQRRDARARRRLPRSLPRAAGERGAHHPRDRRPRRGRTPARLAGCPSCWSTASRTVGRSARSPSTTSRVGTWPSRTSSRSGAGGSRS